MWGWYQRKMCGLQMGVTFRGVLHLSRARMEANISLSDFPSIETLERRAAVRALWWVQQVLVVYRVVKPVGYKETWCWAGREGIWGLVGSRPLMRHCNLNKREGRGRDSQVSAPNLRTEWEQQQRSTLYFFTPRSWRLGFPPCCCCPASMVGLPKVCDRSLRFFCTTEFIDSLSP